MARTERRVDHENPERIPRPVPGGTENIESLGSFIDNALMGHARTDRQVERQLEPLLLDDGEAPEDPPPSQAPPPVPGGEEPITKGGQPGKETRDS